MRLLERDETTGDIRLTSFPHGRVPLYAILSHTWGPDDQEVSFKDLIEGTGNEKAGYGKIRFCTEQAWKEDRLKYCWVDTCCIDKSSSTELQESINRMFQWYRDAARCYVYLADVSKAAPGDSEGAAPAWESVFRKSRWFTRGWTLQELIAPKSVEFFSKEGVRLGDKSSLERHIRDVTGIPAQVLRGKPFTSFTVEERKAWVQKRQTAREEDKAYSLFGLFDVQMPLLYGEGEEKAFRRLDEEIRKAQNIFLEDPNAQACLRDLFLVDPSENKNDLKRKKGERARGTCQWILDTEELSAWLDGVAAAPEQATSNILWLYGNPGTGKSTMAIFLAEELHRMFSSERDKSLAYFFCDSSFDKRRTAAAVLRGLIWQLVDQHRQLLRNILPMYNERGKQLFESFDALWNILTKIAADTSTGRKYCIIDALDECEEAQSTLLDQLRQSFEHESSGTLSGLRILITSRPEQKIAENLSRFANRELTSFTESTRDVERFIDAKVAELKTRKKYTQRVEEQVTQALKDKAAGSFLWVGLSYKDSPLQELPRGLRQLYDKLLDMAFGSDDEESDIIKTILSRVALSVRPLNVSELAEACGLYPVEDEDTRIQFTREHIASCRQMVVIQDERVLLLHQSVKDYLVRSFINETEGHAEFAYRCIDVLIERFSDSKPSLGHRVPKSDTYLGEYAMKHWSNHAGMAQQEFVVKDSQEKFLRTVALSGRWWQSHYGMSCLFTYYCNAPHFSVLHVAALYGKLIDFASRADRLISLDCETDEGITPVELALWSGHRKAVCKLLDAGAKVTRKAIKAAAANREDDPEMLALLIDQLGDKIITEEVVTAAAGSSQTMALLLNKLGDKITITGALIEAVAGKLFPNEVMALLINRKGDQIPATEAVVSLIARSCSADVFVMFLDRRQDQIRITPELLMAAAKNDYGKGIIELLLDRWGDQITITETILKAAAASYFGGEIMELLLDRRGDEVVITEEVV